MRFDYRSAVAALPLGPVLTVVGYLGLREAGAQITDTVLWCLLAFPPLVLLAAAAVSAARRRNAARWVSRAAGAAVGTLILAVVVGGGISVVAGMISDPG